ncbi:hypothetical protein CNMCM5623_004840 [Aspergillus felis]|uniref:Tautomerase cis-CaaD-like domain-containing protein n=1 Tax=Aspergillus felis TaxID=1287682 RepID=A0A8H6PSF8_9EURO|nr:hypothetical protein CNMCM5623_004840 [Aspergillus felis]
MDTTHSLPRRVLLVSMPRTASNLLMKILAIPDQPDVLSNEHAGYFFAPASDAVIRENLVSKPLAQWTPKQIREVQGVLQQCLESLEECSARARDEGKIFFVKEHASWFMNPAALGQMMMHDGDASNGNGSAALKADDYYSLFRVRVSSVYGPRQAFSPMNETVLPDGYLRTWRLAFIIRHPALVCPSMYRAYQALKKLYPPGSGTADGMSWSFLKVNEGQAHPIILDAYDIIHNKSTTVKFCELTGLDPTALKFEWESVSAEGKASSGDGASNQHSIRQEAQAIMKLSLMGSSGVMKEKAPEVVDVASEADKWKHEFGDEEASFILEMAGGEAPNALTTVAIYHIARTFDTQEIQDMFFKTLDDILRPILKPKRIEWEIGIYEGNRDYWRINGLIPPATGSELEKKWFAANKVTDEEELLKSQPHP